MVRLNEKTIKKEIADSRLYRLHILLDKNTQHKLNTLKKHYNIRQNTVLIKALIHSAFSTIKGEGNEN